MTRGLSDKLANLVSREETDSQEEWELENITFGELVIRVALKKHSQGDWGECCDEDKAMNEEALKVGNRLMSVYEFPDNKNKFWVITEWDRSVTTLLLPEDY